MKTKIRFVQLLSMFVALFGLVLCLVFFVSGERIKDLFARRAIVEHYGERVEFCYYSDNWLFGSLPLTKKVFIPDADDDEVGMRLTAKLPRLKELWFDEPDEKTLGLWFAFYERLLFDRKVDEDFDIYTRFDDWEFYDLYFCGGKLLKRTDAR